MSQQSQFDSSQKNPKTYVQGQDQITPVTVRMINSAVVEGEIISIDQRPTTFVTVVGRIQRIQISDRTTITFTDDTGQTIINHNEYKKAASTVELLEKIEQECQDGQQPYCKILIKFGVIKNQLVKYSQNIKLVTDHNQIFHHYASVIAEKNKRSKGDNQPFEEKREIKSESHWDQQANNNLNLSDKILKLLQITMLDEMTVKQIVDEIKGHSFVEIREELQILKRNGSVIEGGKKESYKIL